MTPKMKLGETQSLDELLAAIRAGVNPQELATRVKELTRPDGDRRLPVPWFRWCREAITADSGGVVRERWLDLNDPLEPLRFVKGALTRLAPHDRWLVAALRLAKLARDKSDIVHDGAMPEEHDGVTEIAEQLGLAGERAALWDLYCDYRDLPRPALAQCRIGLPLVRDDGGVLGELRLALMPKGTGQLYRAHSLAFVKIEPDFANAATTALATLAGMGRTLPENQDLRWEVRIRATGAVPPALTGPSCGGAFALGMWVLLAGERTDLRTGVLGPLRSEELSGIAITARVDRQGKLGPIGGEMLKLQAAAKERVLPRIHTFLVHTDQQGLDSALEAAQAELRLLRAPTLSKALDQIFLDRAGRHCYLAVLRGFDHRLWLARDYPHLIGRTWLRERLARFLTEQESGYLLITAGPGVGKTAFLFHQIAAEPAPDAWHFIRQGQGDWDNPDRFLAVLDAQLRLRYSLLPAADSAAGSPSGLFLATLETVAGRLEPGEHCLILLDGLDEAFGPTGRWPMDVLPGLLPETLPRGIYIVLSSRPGEHLRWLADPRRVRRLHLDPADAELWGRQRDDLRQYIAWRAEAIRRDCGLELNSEFQGQLLAASEGLFIAAERFLSDRADLASDLRAWMADPGTLPQGLAGWLQRQWLRIEARARQDGQNPEMLRLLLGLLACAREPLTQAHLRTWRRAGTPSAPGVVEAPAEVGDEPLEEFVKARWDRLLGFAREWFGQDIADDRYRFMHTGFLEFCREHLDDTERRDLNQLLAHWAGGWRGQEGEVRGYALRYLPHHLLEAGQWDGLHEVLTDPAGFLPGCIALGGDAGWPALMEDYRRTLAGWPRERPEQRREIEDLYRVLAQAGHRLVNGREPVIQVLYNGLTGIWGEGSRLGQRLRAVADATRRPWFRLLDPPKHFSPLLRVLVGHQDYVFWLAFSPPDARGRCRLATGSRDDTARVWDPDTGACLQVLEGHGGPIQTLAFSPPDARGRCRLATASEDGTVRVWDLESTAPPQVLEGQSDSIWTLAFGPTAAMGYSWLAAGSRDGKVWVWHQESETPLWGLRNSKEDSDCVWTHAFSSSDALGHCWLAIGTQYGVVWVCDLESDAPLRRLEGNGGPMYTLAFSQMDARGYCWLATGTEDGTARVWNLESADLPRVLEGHSGPIGHLAFGPLDAEGRCRLATGGYDGTVRVWDLEIADPPQVLEGHGDSIWTHAFSPPDAGGHCRLATGSLNGTVRVWDLENGTTLSVLEGHSGPIGHLAFGPLDAEGRYRLATGGYDGTVRVWDLENGTTLSVLEGHSGPIGYLAFSPLDAEGHCRLATASEDGTVRVWDLESETPLRVLEGHGNLDIRSEYTTILAFSPPDARGRCRLATASEDGTVRVWDLESETPLRVLEGHGEPIRIAFSPLGLSGLWFAIGSDFYTVWVWDLGSGRCLVEYPLGGVLNWMSNYWVSELAFDPKAQFLIIVLTEMLLVWDWQRMPHPLSVGLTNLQWAWIDPSDNHHFIAVGVEETNHRPIFYHLRLENFPPPP